MVKHKVTADVRSLADRYFCEQCDRLGLPRPHAIKPIKAPRHAFVKPRSYADAFGGLSTRDTRGFVDPELVAKDREDGLRIEAEMMAAIAPGEPAPKMGLEAIWEAFGEDR